jgi:parallel beta-helix repeat protein
VNPEIGTLARVAAILFVFGTLALSPTQVVAQAAPCGGSLQALVDAAPPNGTVDVPPCLYREEVTVKVPLTLDGHGQAEIRGSDVWSDWTQSGNVWTSAKSVPELGDETKYLSDARCGSTKSFPPTCVYREQVYIDGGPLQVGQPGSVPVSGQFTLNNARQVQLADNPGGHMVEVTTRKAWIDTRSDGVTIRGFTMRHAASPAQVGGLANGGFNNWTAIDNKLSQAHGELISIVDGQQIKVQGNELSGAGEAAIGGFASNVLVQGNNVHDSGSAFASGWGAAGIKLSGHSITLDGNEAWKNPVGLWADVGTTDWVVTNNRVHDNPQTGIIFEISSGAKISGNSVWNNGAGRADWGWGAGILVQTSNHAEVDHNTVAWNYAGISVIDLTTRKDAPPSLDGISVHDNTIVRQITNPTNAPDGFWKNQLVFAADDIDGSKMALAIPSIDGNLLWADQPESNPPVRFTLRNTAWPDLRSFMSSTSDVTSRYLDNGEAYDALKAAGIPTGDIAP